MRTVSGEDDEAHSPDVFTVDAIAPVHEAVAGARRQIDRLGTDALRVAAGARRSSSSATRWHTSLTRTTADPRPPISVTHTEMALPCALRDHATMAVVEVAPAATKWGS
jgi:hypothetical protein